MFNWLGLNGIRIGKLVGQIVLIGILGATLLWALDVVQIKLTDSTGDSNFAVQNSGSTPVFQINSLGSVISGTWLGTTIAIAKGGTNNTSFSGSKFLYYDGSKITESIYYNTDFATSGHTHPGYEPAFTTLGISKGGTNNTSFSGSKFLYYDGSKIAESAYYNTDFATSGHTHAGYQPSNANLTSIAGLGTAANKMLYTTGVTTWAEADLTNAGRAILDDADASAQRTTLGLGSIATLSSPLGTADGGTGQITANAAFNALAPSQAGNSGEFLTTDGSTTSWATVTAAPPDPSTQIELTEEFCGGLAVSGYIGSLNWLLSTIGTAAVVTGRPGETNRWGICRYATSTTINTGGVMQLANGAAATVSAMPQVGTTIKFSLKINSADLLQSTFRIGIADTVIAQPANGIYFEYVSAAAASSWIGVCRAAGVQSVTGNLQTPVLNTWYKFKIRYNAANSVYFSVDNGAETQVTTNIPTLGVIPSIRVYTTVGASKNIEIDYYQIILTGITR